jgi:hypothetical protein
MKCFYAAISTDTLVVRSIIDWETTRAKGPELGAGYICVRCSGVTVGMKWNPDSGTFSSQATPPAVVTTVPAVREKPVEVSLGANVATDKE